MEAIPLMMPKAIGKVVSVTIVPMQEQKTGETQAYPFPGKEETHTGILQSYLEHNKGMDFRLVGGDRIFTLKKKHRVYIGLADNDPITFPKN